MPKRDARPLDERFWEKVDILGADECWPWRGVTTGNRYGKIPDDQAPYGWKYAHRAAYELRHGSDPVGLVVRHTCDNPICVNPAHLLAGTYRDNSRDTLERGRHVTRRKLHPFQVRSIRRRFAAGETQISLAQNFGVVLGTVQNALAGRTYANVLS